MTEIYTPKVAEMSLEPVRWMPAEKFEKPNHKILTFTAGLSTGRQVNSGLESHGQRTE